MSQDFVDGDARWGPCQPWSIGMIPPFELENTYHHNQPAPTTADAALASL